MGFYHDRVLPLLIHLAMRQDRLAAYRRRVVPAAEGRVLEVGVGSGLNLPFYGGGVARVIGLDPSARLLGWARESGAAPPVDLVEGSAERIPLATGSVDTIVTTWTLCSIPDARAALGEMRRVLKPAGRLLFVEHGLAPDPRVRRWQDALTPAWKHLAGGCHLNRPITELIAGSGFRIERLETGYMPGPKPMTFMYEGAARPA
ncbi:MAG: SAM-dependent methyltransferase [Bradyrhizobiaceae bacterium]|nr:MAG: SAM-dependent methyltransferase [Bradyrhizobiaceae bacterium]